MDLTFTSAEVQRLIGQGQSRLSKWKAAGVLVPSGTVERGRGNMTTFHPQDVCAAILCGALADSGYPIERAKPLIHALQNLPGWQGDPEKSKPGNPYIKFDAFPAFLSFDGFTVTELNDEGDRPTGATALVVDVRVMVAATLIASNLRYVPEDERFTQLMGYGATEGPHSRAVTNMVISAQTPKGRDRLLAFLDIDAESDQALFVRHEVAKLHHEAEGRRLAREAKG